MSIDPRPGVRVGCRPFAGVMPGMVASLLALSAHAQSAQPAPLAPPTELAASLATAVPPDLVHVGTMPCASKQGISVQVDPSAPGHFTLQMQGQRAVHRMRLVSSVSGAVRLENEQVGLVWLQLSNKSMLMNQKLGRRLADECMSPLQHAVAESHKTQPPPSIFDVAVTPR